MRGLGLAMTAAIALSMIPATPPAVSAPISIGAAIVTDAGISLVEVSHGRRYCHRDVRRHYHPALRRSAWHRHVGSHCRPRIVRRHHHPRHSDCVKIGDIRICF
jgi:hypothetical protein